MMKQRIIFFILILLVPVLLVFASCRQADETGEPEILLIGNSRDPSSLDPHLSGSWASQKIKDGLFEGLVAVSGADLDIIPGTADRWSISPDGREYCFHLREDARWSDGQAVAVEDFYESFKRLLSPLMATDMATLFLYDISGAKEYHLGLNGDFSSVGVKVAGDRDLLITLEHPNPNFLLALSYIYPIPVHVVERWGSLEDRTNPWMQDGRGVYNGPYFLKSWVSNDRIVLMKNHEYWDMENVSIPEIHFLPISSVVTEELAFRKGEIHVTTKVPPSRISHYEKLSSGAYRNDPVMGTFYLQFNTSIPVLKDVRVRKALAKAIDKQSLVEGVMKDGKLPAALFIPGMEASRTPENRFDAEAARALLADAGYKDGKGFPLLRLCYNTSETYRQLMEAIQFMWKEELGIQVELENQEWSVFLDSMNEGDFDIGRYGFIPPYEDMAVMLSAMTSAGYGNFTLWEDLDFDRMVSDARSTAGDDRRVLCERAAMHLDEEMPIVPIFYYNAVYLKDPRLGGWDANLMDRHPLKDLFWIHLDENLQE